MLKILGILDFLAGMTLLGLKFFDLSLLGWVFSVYLIGKGLVFFDWMGLLDIISGILILLAVFGVFGILSYIAILWLVQKAIFSFI